MKHICLLLIYPSFFSLHGMAQTDSARLANIDRKLERLVERDSTFRRTVDVTAGRVRAEPGKIELFAKKITP